MSGAEVSDGIRLARAALTRIVEPGDERAGRWLREFGAVDVVRRIVEDGEPLPGVSEGRWAGLRARAVGVVPERDLERAAGVGARIVCPGDAEW